MTLPIGFFDRPFAHRALHGAGRPENSSEAIEAAIAAGFGIEIDVQLTRDGQAMVFHDYGLERLTGASGTVQTVDAVELATGGLLGGPTGPPSLSDALAQIRGQVPLVIEIKDQDGAMGPNVGALETQVVTALHSYDGPVAVMSFNPYSARKVADLAPAVPVGLVTCGWEAEEWPLIPAARRAALATLQDVTGPICFVSHDHRDLPSGRTDGLECPLLCWTIRSEKDASQALTRCDQITFEGYLPA